MNPSRREQIKQSIREEIEKTRAAVEAQRSDHRSIAPDRAIGRVSRMDAMYNQQVTIGALHRTRERLSKLEYMLSKVDTPEFGCCEFCKSSIPIARLRAMPESTTCMRCASFSA